MKGNFEIHYLIKVNSIHRFQNGILPPNFITVIRIITRNLGIRALSTVFIKIR